MQVNALDRMATAAAPLVIHSAPLWLLPLAEQVLGALPSEQCERADVGGAVFEAGRRRAVQHLVRSARRLDHFGLLVHDVGARGGAGAVGRGAAGGGALGGAAQAAWLIARMRISRRVRNLWGRVGNLHVERRQRQLDDRCRP